MVVVVVVGPIPAGPPGSPHLVPPVPTVKVTCSQCRQGMGCPADGIPGSSLQCLASVFTTLDQTRPDCDSL